MIIVPYNNIAPSTLVNAKPFLLFENSTKQIKQFVVSSRNGIFDFIYEFHNETSQNKKRRSLKLFE
jgi:hypothetical protein